MPKPLYLSRDKSDFQEIFSFNGSNTDCSFTKVVSNSFMSSHRKNLIAADLG